MSFCEARLCGWVAEPSNAWSSFGYVAIALWLFTRPAARASWLLKAVAFAGLMIGIGSFVFHGTGTFAGELVDLSGMFLLSGMMLSLALGRAWRLGRASIGVLWAFFTLMPMATVFIVKPAGIPLFALELNLAIGLEVWLWRRRESPHFRFFGQALGLVTGAFVVWTLDITRVACAPDNHLVTGHAVWHVLNAIAIARLFAFYAARFVDEPESGAQLEVPMKQPG